MSDTTALIMVMSFVFPDFTVSQTRRLVECYANHGDIARLLIVAHAHDIMDAATTLGMDLDEAVECLPREVVKLADKLHAW